MQTLLGKLRTKRMISKSKNAAVRNAATIQF